MKLGVMRYKSRCVEGLSERQVKIRGRGCNLVDGSTVNGRGVSTVDGSRVELLRSDLGVGGLVGESTESLVVGGGGLLVDGLDVLVLGGPAAGLEGRDAREEKERARKGERSV
jgi:hypothetical protein